MHKATTINVRIESKLKAQAEAILRKVGLEPAEAVKLFYMQICLHKGLPFNVKVPNKETVNAMRAANKREAQKATNVDELFNCQNKYTNKGGKYK